MISYRFGFLYRHELAMLKVVVELISLHGLMDKEILRDIRQFLAVFRQDLFAVRRGLIEDLLYFLIDSGCRLFGIALGGTKITSDKDGGTVFPRSVRPVT